MQLVSFFFLKIAAGFFRARFLLSSTPSQQLRAFVKFFGWCASVLFRWSVLVSAGCSSVCSFVVRIRYFAYLVPLVGIASLSLVGLVSV